jgi:cyclopropane fatty-acyl-phospholipid synthase-like methyltransferase
MKYGMSSIYDDAFFDKHSHVTVESARLIIPLLLRLIHLKSVIDIGCALGAWLKVFAENGVETIRGLDGHHVDPSKLLIESRCFTPVTLEEAVKGNLSEDIKLDERYDLAVCLEVAEHLPASSASSLIRTLTTLAPFVLFSAAIPGQRGIGHVNEQWPAYWKALFEERGFQRLDPIRRHIWRDDRIPLWYRQNIFLYASRDAMNGSEALHEEEKFAELDVMYIEFLSRYKTLKGVLGELPRVIKNSIKNRIRLTTLSG